MVGVREDLIVLLDGVDTDRMLAFWRWLVPDTFRPLFATALGDLFLTGPDGRVLWLDVGNGRLWPVARNTAEFKRLAASSDDGDFWFGPPLVDRLVEAGKVLGAGECYSYITLPMLGGDYGPANFRTYDVLHHFQVWGPIHEQLHDLPDGATVEFKIVE